MSQQMFLRKVGGFKPFILQVKTDNTGTSSSNQFTIPTNPSFAYDYEVETSDGQVLTGLTGDTTITFSTSGTYDVRIKGTFPAIYYNNGGDRLKLLDVKQWGNIVFESLFNSFYGCENAQFSATDRITDGGITNLSSAWRNCSSATSFPLIDTSKVTNFYAAWLGCSSLTSFPQINTSAGTDFSFAWQNCSSLTSFPLINTSAGTDFSFAWRGCSSLTSFPLINSSAGTNFYAAWQNCSSLTSFPLINTSAGTDFSFAWRGCSSLTSFPLINSSAGTNFYAAWFGCSSLTSFPLINSSAGTNFSFAWRGCSSLTSFPLIDTSAGTDFAYAWQNCSSLTSFPANFFNGCSATNFINAFVNTNLSQQSIDDILVSIESNGTSSGTFNQSGGSAPFATGEVAIIALRGRGWTVTVTV